MESSRPPSPCEKCGHSLDRNLDELYDRQAAAFRRLAANMPGVARFDRVAVECRLCGHKNNRYGPNNAPH